MSKETCKICNKEFVALGSHLKHTHDISKAEYVNTYDPKICIICNIKIKKPRKNSQFCSSKCSNQHTVNKLRAKKEELNKNDELSLECKICGFKARQLHRHVKGAHNIKAEDYTQQYGSLFSESNRKIRSDNTKGEKNPGYQHGGKLSPFSKKFVGYDNLSLEEKKKKISKTAKEAQKNARENGNLSTTLDYYIKRGATEEEAKKLLHDRQATFTLEKCKQKYGEIKGVRVWLKRQEKWLDTLNNKSDDEKAEINLKKIINRSTRSYSLSSQKLFWELYNKRELKTDIFFEELNYEYYIKVKTNYFLYDYIDLKNKKCIEFNGDFWHCNPNKYTKKDKMNFPGRRKNMLAEEVWNRDKIKNDTIKNKGFQLLIIWESDYINNPQEIIEKCLDFLQN